MYRHCACLFGKLSTSFSRQYSRTLSYSYSSVKKSVYKFHHRCYSKEFNDLHTELNEDDFEDTDEQSTYRDTDFESLANGDVELLKLLKLVQLEIDILAQEGHNIPSIITNTQWLELASSHSKSQRIKLLSQLWRKEARKLGTKYRERNDESKMKRYREKNIVSTNSPVEYGLLGTTLFHRLYEPDMKKLYNFRLLQAMMFGPHIIVDCGFEQYMTSGDITISSSDILQMWSRNREHFYPYDIIFCNLNKNKSALYSRLCGVLPHLEEDPAFPFNFTDKSYFDLYPRDKLIYLTPDCKELMEEYDHDSVYILGCISEKKSPIPLTMAKAKKEGLRMAKFPLDKYLDWNHGRKSLSLNTCLAILSDLKDGRDWNFALRHVKQKSAKHSFALLDDAAEPPTNTKTAEYIEEKFRRKLVYDLLLK